MKTWVLILHGEAPRRGTFSVVGDPAPVSPPNTVVGGYESEESARAAGDAATAFPVLSEEVKELYARGEAEIQRRFVSYTVIPGGEC